MGERTVTILRAGALFGALMQRSAVRTRGSPVKIALATGAAASGGSAALADSEEAVPSDPVLATEDGTSSDEERSGSVVKSVGEQISMGGVLGFAAGYSIRKVGKAMLFLVGTEVCILQYMAYREWLTMDWRRLGRDLAPKFSKSAWEGIVEILVYKMPFSAAFSGGLAAGLRLSSTK